MQFILRVTQCGCVADNDFGRVTDNSVLMNLLVSGQDVNHGYRIDHSDSDTPFEVRRPTARKLNVCHVTQAADWTVA